MEHELAEEEKERESNIITDIKEMGMLMPVRLEWLRF
jgi:hypothetical protein